VQTLLLTPAEVGTGFTKQSFTPDNTTPTSCGQENVNKSFPPDIDVGALAVNTSVQAQFEEEVGTYKDEATATKAFTAGLDGISCTQPTLDDGSAVTFSQPKDVSSDLGVDGALEVDVQSSTFTGQLFAVRSVDVIVTFQFAANSGADTSTLADPASLAKQGLQKLGLA
jgi:hypothetical protein